MIKSILMLILLFTLVFSHAETVTVTTGAGSAVVTANRVAYFTSIYEGMPISAYTENLLSITTPGTAHLQFDPNGGSGLNGFSGGFFYPSGGTNGCITIKTTDGAKIYALEFNAGDGFGGVDTYVHWEAVRSSVIIASGYFTTTGGQVIGFKNDLGFDEFRFGGYSTLALAQTATASSYHAGALDNLKVSLIAQTPVPEPSSLLLLSLVACLVGFKNRRK